ncbi:MAG TPA: 16S rRNA (guanine(966)-N(2))-methyltransferase RsmD [Humisphaera sp.]|nr:16S rRNA (guanine(966)-N(2))-methyltransferase RsmD [Humisphaera sp.]
MIVRIIAGEFRGRKLLPPQGLTTRPITDRVKQSLFDILTPMFPDSRVYDCFAGTGSMGLECLSRGASAVTFFEADRSALERLRKNIETIDNERRCKVIAGDLFRWFDRPLSTDATDRADLIFLDPPYRFVREEPQKLQRLAGRFAEHLSADGVLIFRHDVNDALELPPLERFDRREYGGMVLEFLRRPK